MRSESFSQGVDNVPNNIETFADVEGVKLLGDIEAVVVSGVDNSIIAGYMLKDYILDLGLKLPVFINESVEIPYWANSRTLIFVLSHSGSDLEAMKSYKMSVGRGAKIVVVSSDGKLKKMAQENNVSFIKLPDGLNSRTSFFLSFIAMVNTLIKNDVIRESVDFFKIARVLRKESFKENAEVFANRLVSKLPIIYTSERFSSVGFAWKRFFNLNSKIIAFNSLVPEACYSDMEGYATCPDNAYAIFLRDAYENKHINKEIDTMKEFLKRNSREVSELKIKGSDFLIELFSTIYFGLLTSLKLGIILENDVESLNGLDFLKKKLKSIY